MTSKGDDPVKNVVISPCSNPELDLDTVLSAYAAIGYTRFEAFSGWVASALDYRNSPSDYLEIAKRYGMSFYSFHLPVVTEQIEDSLLRTIQAAQFAADLGAEIVLFKAASRELYIKSAVQFLDAIAHLRLTPVLQNHSGSPISTLSEYREVIDGIADKRMKTLLEVGHFHSSNVSWMEGYHLLGDSIALVHIKDQIGKQSVPFGHGEIDLPSLFKHMRHNGYNGKYVIEMEVRDKENTLTYLRDAYKYVHSL